MKNKDDLTIGADIVGPILWYIKRSVGRRGNCGYSTKRPGNKISLKKLQ